MTAHVIAQLSTHFKHIPKLKLTAIQAKNIHLYVSFVTLTQTKQR